MRVFLVEPYFSGSHQAWAEGFEAASSHEIHLLTLPGRFWKWRMFGGSLTLAHMAVELSARVGPPDVVLASDMLDIPSFLGHSQPQLGDPDVVLYMHENQLTYPLSPTARDDLAYAYMNWSSMVRADQVWFNSEFHRTALLEAVPRFVSHFPDHRHNDLIGAVQDKSTVLPVGVDLSWVGPMDKREPPLIIWNQRWEYDKDPARFLNSLYRLQESGGPFRVAICGENFRNVPSEFDDAADRLGSSLAHMGYADTALYRQLLNQAAIVVSTARHEFFGIGAVEAMAAGAIPVFPNDLSYPELIPQEVHDRTLYETDPDLDKMLAAALIDQAYRDSVSEVVAPAMRRFEWSEVAPSYDQQLRR